MQEIVQSLSNVDMINLVSIIDKLQCFETKNLCFIKFWILDKLFMEHPVIVIMPLKVIPYIIGSGVFPRPKVIYTEKFDTKIMRSDLQEYSSLSVNIFQMQFISWYLEQYIMHMRIFGMRMHLEEVPILT